MSQTASIAPAVQVSDLTKRFGAVTAVDNVSFAVKANTITGLLGRNGAGKTTIMELLTGQQFRTTGTIRVFGESPVENARVLRHVCFIKESQRYPEDFRPIHVMRAAPWFFENWDQELADRLVDEFRLPMTRRVKKLSRGQHSAIGVIVGLASRAPLTIFDEPYLGLDAVARQLFYDHLLEDYAAHPRTVVLSTHLIDEVANLLERVIVVDSGRILLDDDADHLRGSVTTVAGTASAVDAFARGKQVHHRQSIGSLAQVTMGALSAAERAAANAAGLDVSAASLQQLIVRRTTEASGEGRRAEMEQSA